MTITPTNDNVIIKLEEVPQNSNVTASGIFLPKSNEGSVRPDRGIVVAVGPGRVLNSGAKIVPEVQENDEVIFNKFSGTEIITESGKYLMVKENDILAIIKE